MDPIITSSAITTTLPISQFMQMFATPTPFAGPGGMGIMDAEFMSSPITYAFDYMTFLTSTAPFVSTAVTMVSDSVVHYYFTVRIALTALMAVLGFVMKRLGVPVKTEPLVTIGGRSYGERLKWNKRLPKL